MREIRTILLNGCSSSGKSTLAALLQSSLPGMWVTYGLDTLSAGLPAPPPEPGAHLVAEMARNLDVLDDEFGAFVARANARDVCVVLDWVCQRGRRDHDRWRAHLGPALFWVNVHTPLPVLEERERLRGDRAPGLARFQFPLVHRDVPADLTLDTHAFGPQAAAAQVCDALATAGGRPPIPSPQGV